MKASLVLGSALFLVITFTSAVSSARILGVFPHIGKSHYFVFEPLMKALAARGHDVHVISHFPQDKPVTNFTDISVKGAITEFEPVGGIGFDLVGSPSKFVDLISAGTLGYLGTTTCKAILAYPSVQKLLHSDATFDLVVTELFNSDCLLGFTHRFQAPNVALSSGSLVPWASDRFGNPDHTGYIANLMSGSTDRMSFYERLENTVFVAIFKLTFYLTHTLPSQSISTRYFGEDSPSVVDMARNTSLILVNGHASILRPRPLVPAVVDVGGIHVKAPKKLPVDLEKWINESRDGVIFFSMGSMLRGDTIPKDKLDALLGAFSELPQRVLWKWEGDSMPGKPDNVRISNWLPQRDILNHPNVRLFVTHCGLLGMTEAVQSSVPMVAIPMYGDQNTNYKALEQAGVAAKISFDGMTKETVLSALHTVLNNPSYVENAKILSKQFLDRPLSALDTAIFWTEYVIRHKGASHLRSAAIDLYWYQYLLLDVILVLAIVALPFFLITKYFVKKTFRLAERICCQKCHAKSSAKYKQQ